MINYYDGQITDILPFSLSEDPATQALSYAIREGTRMLYRYTQFAYVYASIDQQKGEVLDLMAAELRTQYYSDGLDIETKRALVRNTLIWYMTAGTPAAVEELVAVVFGEGEVKEWFEYGSSPYLFKIVTNAILTEDMDLYFSHMIRKVKNTRSHIEAIEIHRTVEQPLYAGVGNLPQYKPAAILDGYRVAREAAQSLYAGVSGEVVYKPAPIADGYRVEREAAQEAYAGAGGQVAYKPAAILDGYKIDGKDVHQIPIQAGTAQASTEKQAAIRESLEATGEPVQQTIYAASALNSKYKNTITE